MRKDYTKLAYTLLSARLKHALALEKEKNRLLQIETERPLTKEEKAEYDWLKEGGKQVGFKELSDLCKSCKADSPQGFEGWNDD